MDEIDKRILGILYNNARATVKEIASEVSLTSPAVSERIRRMEQKGIIAGYTVRFSPQVKEEYINALISISIEPTDREAFLELLEKETDVQQCFQVTGSHSHMVKVSCKDIAALEKLINRMQKLGRTNTQIILSVIEKNELVF